VRIARCATLRRRCAERKALSRDFTDRADVYPLVIRPFRLRVSARWMVPVLIDYLFRAFRLRASRGNLVAEIRPVSRAPLHRLWQQQLSEPPIFISPPRSGLSSGSFVKGEAYRRGGILFRAAVCARPSRRFSYSLKANAGGPRRRFGGTREGSVPRIVGFRFLEEPQTNWRTIDTKKAFGHEPAHTWSPARVAARGSARTRASIARGDATCVTIPLPRHPLARDDPAEDVVTAVGRNLLCFRANRAKTHRPPIPSPIARHRRRRSTGSLAFLEIPRPLLLFPCVSPRDIRRAIFHAFFPASLLLVPTAVNFTLSI